MSTTPTSIAPPALRRRLALLLLAPLLCLAGAQSASAAVPGLTPVTSTDGPSSFNKSANVTCPGNGQVLGVGGGIGGGAGQVIVDDWMQLDTTRAGVRGVEANAFAPSWSVTATALCADPLPGRVQVVATTGPSSLDKFAVATCPPQTELVASGADILSGQGDVMIERMVPDRTTNSVSVLAHEHTPTGRGWQARASAICATPLPGMVREFATSGPSSATTQVAVAACRPGTVLVGTGAETLESGGEAAVESITPDLTANTVTARASEIDPTTLSWRVTAFAMCANP
jgi:hypothetical protein